MTTKTAKTTKSATSENLKLASLVDLKAITTTKSALFGDCLIHRTSPDVSLENAWLLPDGETREIAPGQSFSILSSQDGKCYTIKGFTALGKVTLTGPLIWTEIEAPESVGERLAGEEHKVAEGEDKFFLSLVCAAAFILTSLIAVLVGREAESHFGPAVVLVLAVGCGLVAAKAILAGCSGYGRELLGKSGGIFISEGTFFVPEGVKCLSREAAE